MAIETLEAYKLALSGGREIIPITIGSTSLGGTTFRPFDLWRTTFPISGGLPGASTAPDRTTLGALGQQNPPGGQQLSIIGARFNGLNPGVYIVADRLVHSSGLSGTTTGTIDSTVNADNFPTAPLTRYTDGQGVMVGLTMYSAVGNTGSTVGMTYTNTTPTSGRVGPLVVMGGFNFREQNRMILLPLAEGDTGVRSVQSIQRAATTGTVGDFGITMFKPLYVICLDETSGVVSASGFITGRTSGGIPAIANDACLFLINIPGGGRSAQGAGMLLTQEN